RAGGSLPGAASAAHRVPRFRRSQRASDELDRGPLRRAVGNSGSHWRRIAMTKPLRWPAGTEPQQGRLHDLSDAELLKLESEYCSHGDTVHYTDPPKIFDR